jgi:hypothetical protein
MSLILDGTNGLSDVDGSAATPALRGSDANTGIFFPAADTIAFAEGGAEVARFDASGNLCVGSTAAGNPATKSVSVGLAGTTTGGIQLWSPTTSAHSVQWGDGTSSTDPYRGYIEYDHASDSMRFATSSTERARIDSSGNLLVGSTNTDAGIGNTNSGTQIFLGGYLASRASGTSLFLNRNTTDGATAEFRRQGNQVGSISVTTTATAYNTSSDYRLKEAITPMTGALAKVALLKPCTYKWKVDGSDGQGFIAHELAEVVPHAVTGEKDAVQEEKYEVTPAVKDEEGNTVTEAVMGTRIAPAYQGIDVSFLVATLTAAIQEQQALITQLQADVALLKGTTP